MKRMIEMMQTTIRVPRRLLEEFDRDYVMANLFRSRNQAIEALIRQALEEQRRRGRFSRS